MKPLPPSPSQSYCPVLADDHGTLWTDSLTIAEAFGRRHDHVLRSIDQLIADGTIGLPNFGASSYLNKQNKAQRLISLDERGFLIAMPFIGGRRARQGQVQLVDEFLALRRELTRHTESRLASTESRLTTIEEVLYDLLNFIAIKMGCQILVGDETEEANLGRIEALQAELEQTKAKVLSRMRSKKKLLEMGK